MLPEKIFLLIKAVTSNLFRLIVKINLYSKQFDYSFQIEAYSSWETVIHTCNWQYRSLFCRSLFAEIRKMSGF